MGSSVRISLRIRIKSEAIFGWPSATDLGRTVDLAIIVCCLWALISGDQDPL
jgi:hypothetical protein